MNENLPERFRRRRGGPKDSKPSDGKLEIRLSPQKLNPKILEYFEAGQIRVEGWLGWPELPSSAEVLDVDSGSATSSDIVVIPTNKATGAWASKGEYLNAQYELLREDAIQPLRKAVMSVKCIPGAVEDTFTGKFGIYSRVHICAITPSTRGIAVKVTFSLERVGKKIIWEQSKRLISGTVVVLTPTSDMFATTAIVATVAARPLAGLQQNPPEVDLFFTCADELEIDPSVEFLMVEDRGSLWEADRHTLVALQRMATESFPLSEHLVEADTVVSPPQYILENPRLSLSTVLNSGNDEKYEDVDSLRDWPSEPGSSELDHSQLAALQRILTKRLAIIQGPPGTGKTYVSVQAIKIMLANRKDDDPPIIIACQTNHAIDQILRHIAEFETEFVRLGGRCKDRGFVKERTLYAVREETSESPPHGCQLLPAKKKMAELTKEIGILLSPLLPSDKPLDHHALEAFKILSKTQVHSLESGASKWVQDRKSNPNEASSPFKVWLGDQLLIVPPKQQPEDFGFDFEEVDVGFEQLKELEAENNAQDDEEFEMLYGTTFSIADNFTCRKSANTKVKECLKQQDFWKIPEAHRGAVYRYLQQELKARIRDAFLAKAAKYDMHAGKRRIGRWEADECILKEQKVIGMTTTGFSKYRGLISALQPKVVLIEEAAELLEAPVTVTCLPSLEHLILVGDHQQLRPHTHVREHEDAPYFLNVSLFERMINNQVEYNTLVKQRRMIPEIRRLLQPIYGNLIQDHLSVTDPENRPNVPGMGGVNSYFFTHQWPEQRDALMSVFNETEAAMIAGFVEYLVYNGMRTEDITVLTFYNGQRKRILSELRKRPSLYGQWLNVVTVDSYQGEENKVVCLSLVRSNNQNSIGFLDVDNRVCVALSRAQRGFYIFGNGQLLWDYERPQALTASGKKPPRKTKKTKSTTWQKVISIMAATEMTTASKKRKEKKINADMPTFRPQRLGPIFDVFCSNHNTETKLQGPQDWERIVGGCEALCQSKLPCGHLCKLSCHPFSHEELVCQKCPKMAADARTETKESPVKTLTSNPTNGIGTSHTGFHSSSSSASSWLSFASSEPARYAQAIADAPKKLGPSEAKLFDLDDETLSLCESKLAPLDLDGNGSERSGSLSIAADEKVEPVEKPMHKLTRTTIGSTFKDWSKEASLLD